MTDVTCETCVYFKLFAPEQGLQNRGACRRHPPRSSQDTFPSLLKTDWCGEYEAPET